MKLRLLLAVTTSIVSSCAVANCGGLGNFGECSGTLSQLFIDTSEVFIKFQATDMANLPCALAGTPPAYIRLKKSATGYQDYYQLLLLAAATNANIEVVVNPSSPTDTCDVGNIFYNP